MAATKPNLREMIRLNPNQMQHRAGRVQPLLITLPGDQVFLILDQLGMIDRMIDAGMIAVPDRTASGRMADIMERDPDEAAHTAIMRGLERSDPQIVRLYQEMRDRANAKQSFMVNVNITPYRIADTSLRRIVMEADATVLEEILHAVVERSVADKCKGMIVITLKQALEAWLSWAKGGGLTAKKKDEDEAAGTA